MLTETTSPGILITVQVLIATVRSTSTVGQAVAFGAVAVLFAAVLPMGYVIFGARVGRWANHHIPVRRQRLVPMCVGIVSLVVGVLVLRAVGSPRYLTGIMAINAAGMVALTVVTAWWKISAHTSMSAATATMLLFVIGPDAALLLPLPCLTGWSRLHLRAHTLAQILAGAAVGIVTNGGGHLLLA